jgi:hypothetical protein
VRLAEGAEAKDLSEDGAHARSLRKQRDCDKLMAWYLESGIWSGGRPGSTADARCQRPSRWQRRSTLPPRPRV